MKTIRHTVNVPGQMEQLLNERIKDFRSLSGYFVALCFTDLLYLPKRPIARAFANGSWQQQHRAIENLITLRKHGWKGINIKVHFDAVTQAEKVAKKCLKPGDWVLDRIEEELAFMRGADFRRYVPDGIRLLVRPRARYLLDAFVSLCATRATY